VTTHQVVLPSCSLSNNSTTILRCQIGGVVDGYYSVEKFQNAYKWVVTPLGDKSFWPVVDISKAVGAPLAKRPMGWQQKNRIKSCLESGSGKKPSGNAKEKTRKLIRAQFRCPNCGELGHRKNSSKCHLNETKKRQDSSFMPILLLFLFI
jgi:ribosomal protein L44E